MADGTTSSQSSESGSNRPQLPIEVIGRVLATLTELSLDDCSCHTYPFPHHACHTRFLLSASLVCKEWSPEAVRLLWRTTDIRSELVAERILNSPAYGKYNTRNLYIEGGWKVEDGVSAVNAERLLGDGGLRGLQRVELAYFRYEKSLRADVFWSPNLSGLTWLGMSSCFLQLGADARDPIGPPSFSLRNLALFNYEATAPFPLFSFFFSPSLIDLAFNVKFISSSSCQPHHNDLLIALAQIAPNLTTLDADIFPYTIPAFAHFTRLVKLYIIRPIDLVALLGILPSELKELALGYAWPPELILSAMEKIVNLRSVSSLAKLSIRLKVDTHPKQIEPFVKKGVEVEYRD